LSPAPPFAIDNDEGLRDNGGMKPGVCVVLLLGTGIALGQPAAKFEFEAATVKPFNPDNYDPARGMFSGGPGTSDPGLLRSSLPLRSLMMIAYQVHSDQIAGPGWIEDTRFDVRAKVPAGATWPQVRIMLRNLIVERFAVQLHHEMREFPAYDMTVAKGGPKLKETEYPNASPRAPANIEFALDKNGFPIIPKDLAVEARLSWIKKDAIYSTFRAFSSARLADEVAGALPDLLPRESREGLEDVPARVIDKTGLTGKYDFTLEYQSESVEATGPSIFKALENQLGLHLEKIKLPLDVIVIDHIEKTPQDN
jgi:uncharacterized protein (TIGR03435 family)